MHNALQKNKKQSLISVSTAPKNRFRECIQGSDNGATWHICINSDSELFQIEGYFTHDEAWLPNIQWHSPAPWVNPLIADLVAE